jgi:hypothetical protein
MYAKRSISLGKFRRMQKSMKDGQYRSGASAFFFLGFLGLFFIFEGTLPLNPGLSGDNTQVAPLGEYLHLQAIMPPVAETGDEYDAFGAWNCLPGPFLRDPDPENGAPFSEQNGSYRADRGAVSPPISRSPPGFSLRSIAFQPN